MQAVGLAAKISIKQDPDNKMSNGDGSNEQLFGKTSLLSPFRRKVVKANYHAVQS